MRENFPAPKLRARAIEAVCVALTLGVSFSFAAVFIVRRRLKTSITVIKPGHNAHYNYCSISFKEYKLAQLKGGVPVFY